MLQEKLSVARLEEAYSRSAQGQCLKHLTKDQLRDEYKASNGK